MTIKLIFVGGFLGAGKTTLLWQSAKNLVDRGARVGLITNDQAPDLVDTALLSRSGAVVREVAGSCFCCNFDGLIGAVHSLTEQHADIIIAEPVGSCTDLSATIIQPLKDKYSDIDIAPLTILVDSNRVLELLQEKSSLLHPSALYIMRLQMEEADRILINKADSLSADDRRLIAKLLRKKFSHVKTGEISARNNKGVDAWLDDILLDHNAGKRIVEVDYDRYAEGEAVLGWLNAIVTLKSSPTKIEWSKYALDIMNRLHETFKLRKAEIGHVKLRIESNGDECLANLTHLNGEIFVNGGSSFIDEKADLILNARVQMPPEELEEIVRAVFSCSDLSVSAEIKTLRCLMPGRPNPTYRYSCII
jgi:G3E family GTPase